MSEATIGLTVMTGVLLLSFGGFLIWGFRSGQFKDIEEAKYQLFKKEPTDADEQATIDKGGAGK